MKRGQYRNLIITLTQELQTIYLDEEENVRYLDEISQPLVRKHEASTFTQVTTESKSQSLASLTQSMNIDKFIEKNRNAK